MKRVYVNEKWCLGCHLCEFYCAFAATGEADMARALKDKQIKPRVNVEEHGGICFAVVCRHCSEPLCAKSCIAGAIKITNGVVAIDRAKCVGCFTCVMVCPYGALSPCEDGTMQKCELCTHAGGGSPACVRGCPNGAIVYEERG